VIRSLAARMRLGLGGATLGTVVEQLAAVHGGRRLVEDSDGLVLSYREAADRVACFAGWLAGRIGPGDRVVVATPNGYDQLLVSLAVCRAGGIAVPVNPQMRGEEVDHVVADAGASVIVRSTDDIGDARPLERARATPGAVAALFYTSGTTGRPKGVELTHQGLLGAMTRAALVGHVPLRRDEAVVALPVAHIMGFAVLLGLACAAVPAFVLPRFRADEVLDAIERRRATIFVGVPAMYRLLLEAGAEERNLSSIRVWASGADVMPADVAARFQRLGAAATLPGVGPVGQAVFFEGYGLAESAGAVAVKASIPMLDRFLPGDSVGTPLPGYSFRIVDEQGHTVPPGQVGELWVKGPGVTPGYWGDVSATEAVLSDDGWLRTGDLARRGPFGTIRFAGRSKHVIKRGGFSVYAVEVEAALESHPDVVEASVVGLPDERLGEVPAAAVRLASGASVEPTDLVAFAHEHLASYKVPVQVVVVDELPRTGSQKVQKDRLLALFEPRPDDAHRRSGRS
jgi:acyl-CoA synthetase (AMP-forming)/AMP-acid ligase II